MFTALFLKIKSHAKICHEQKTGLTLGRRARTRTASLTLRSFRSRTAEADPSRQLAPARAPGASATTAPDTENWSHRQSRLSGSHATGPKDPETTTAYSNEAWLRSWRVSVTGAQAEKRPCLGHAALGPREG